MIELILIFLGFVIILILIGTIRKAFGFALKIAISIAFLLFFLILFIQLDFSRNADSTYFLFEFEENINSTIIHYPSGNFREIKEINLNNSIIFYIEGNYSSDWIKEKQEEIEMKGGIRKKMVFLKILKSEEIAEIRIQPIFISSRILMWFL